MKLDLTMRGPTLAEAGDWARSAEELGAAGLFTTETNHDPFFPLVRMATKARRVELGTGIALAFPRSPMHLAYAAWDLQALSGGRFVLGLGSQVRAHVIRRFSAAYDHPARRMREIVLALRAIWRAWEEESELRFEGEFFRHTLMPPRSVYASRTTVSPIAIVPAVQGMSPAIIRSSVLLPQPDGPSSETNSPGWMSSETLSSANTGSPRVS
ncbi:MAG: LLM class flavin-dependent oxidoreductase [Actinobacteria bacterium]|nr:LLM class flavin-dependent oxidoreductase [Actinomycetota bacterium]